MKLIDKDTLVAEIEKRKNLCEKIVLDLRTQENKDYYQGIADAYKGVLGLLDILEVKKWDIEKELSTYLEVVKATDEDIDFVDFAKHFFELGMAVNNPIIASNRGIAEEIIVNLKRVENDYHIDLTKQMEWLRNIVKKGE